MTVLPVQRHDRGLRHGPDAASGGCRDDPMLVNLLLLRGNIGKQGAGICPVRGHSNVQGQRTVGITEKPELVPLDRLAAQYGFEPPREKGMDTVEACEGILHGEVRAFVMFGGNFVRAVPDRGLMEPAWRKLRLTVNVQTKLNRSHLVHGEISYILPVKSRIEVDKQGGVPQALSMEDTSACIHGSRGVRAPASKYLLSEVEVLARMAKATLDPNPKVPWDAWMSDYSRIRRSIAETYPDIFHDYERRMWEPGGFHRYLPARERVWHTKTGKANIVTPTALEEDLDMPEIGHDVLRLMTLRSNDQFNTTVYGYDDRFRGVEGTRMIVFMNRNDIERLGLREGDNVTLTTSTDDGVQRELMGLAGDALRHSCRLHRSLLSGSQCAAAAMAPRQRQQDTRGQEHSGHDRPSRKVRVIRQPSIAPQGTDCFTLWLAGRTNHPSCDRPSPVARERSICLSGICSVQWLTGCPPPDSNRHVVSQLRILSPQRSLRMSGAFALSVISFVISSGAVCDTVVAIGDRMPRQRIHGTNSLLVEPHPVARYKGSIQMIRWRRSPTNATWRRRWRCRTEPGQNRSALAATT